MKINTGVHIERSSTVQKQGGVVIDPNPIREREMLDKDGNVIDPRTKQIIRKADNQ